jgi:hypothetical protein
MLPPPPGADSPESRPARAGSHQKEGTILKAKATRIALALTSVIMLVETIGAPIKWKFRL